MFFLISFNSSNMKHRTRIQLYKQRVFTLYKDLGD